jgi:tetratricopeptide (TPR) repeat protein
VSFTPDGHRLVLSTAEGKVAVWDADFLDAKSRAQAAKERVLDWHWAQAQNAYKEAPFAVIFHTTPGIAAQPQEFKWYHYRGWSYAELRQWEYARADYAQAVQLRPGLGWLWHQHAIACLGSGDTAAYHSICVQMLEHFDRNPGADLNCLYACAPDPKAGNNPARLVALCRTAVEARKAILEKTKPNQMNAKATRASYAIALRAYGAALYRAGQAKEAVAALEKARQYYDYAPRAWDRLFLALACQDCGEVAKAREEFGQAVQEITAAAPAGTRGSTWLSWHEQVEVEALRREAEAKLGKG